jgi:5-methylcytosine-specific restriction endonuclease McrA
MPPGWGARRAAKLKATPYCERCGAVAITVDHILARRFGGGEEDSNLMSLCRTHAAAKDHLDRERGKRFKQGGGTP